MLKKTFKYTNLNGVDVEETCYFNLTKTEIMAMDFESYGSLSEQLTKIAKEQDAQRAFPYFKKIVLKAYGERSLDGKSFDKSEEARQKFENSMVFDMLMWELLTEDGAAGAFFNAIIPAIPQDHKKPEDHKESQ